MGILSVVIVSAVNERSFEFACKSRACAPPPVGVGGSVPQRAQHVAPSHSTGSIMSEGLMINPGWVAKYGPASYLGMEGDKKSAAFYGSRGRDRTPSKSSVVVGDLTLERPLVVSGKDEKEIRKDLIMKLGGPKVVSNEIQKMYDEDIAVIRKIQREELIETKPGAFDKLMETDPTEAMYWDFEAGSVDRMDQRVRTATSTGSMYALGNLKWSADPKRIQAAADGETLYSSIDTHLARVAKRKGHDALVVYDMHGFTPAVGGSQVVLFEPAKFKPTGVKALKEYLSES